MKKILSYIKKIILIIIIIGLATLGIDYLRMTSGEVPIFNISSYNSKTKIQTFTGLFYKAQRKVAVSTSESLVDSSKIKFSVFTINLNVPKQYKEETFNYTIVTKETKNCTSPVTLYYADKDIKVYTYCLDSIKIKSDNKSKDLITYLEKDNTILDDIDSKLSYNGLNPDDTVLYFTSSNDSFTNYGLTMYRCSKENINDVYIGPKDMTFQSDFCTYKDDDFKFMYEIEEDEREVIDSSIDYNQKEVFYEDETYRYEFDTIKSDLIFITTPEVRGKAATKTPLKTILASNILTIDELEKKGLVFTKIDKAKEKEELEKAKNTEETVENSTTQ
jgi:hypothetical protein